MTVRTLSALVLIVAFFGLACGSINRVTPAELDNAAMEADVRGKIAQAVPEKTFAIQVKVDNGVVTLSGHAKSQSDIDKIIAAARSVSGVRSVISNLHVEP
jgi:hyperosmotically inducible periplasmic protein